MEEELEMVTRTATGLVLNDRVRAGPVGVGLGVFLRLLWVLLFLRVALLILQHLGLRFPHLH